LSANDVIVAIEHDDNRSVNDRAPGGSASWFDSHDGTDTISCGPCPRTLKASRVSPLIA
jgi:hypothetical protein